MSTLNRSRLSLTAPLVALVGTGALALATGSRVLSFLTLGLAICAAVLALPAVLLALLLRRLAGGQAPRRLDGRRAAAPTLSLVAGSRGGQS
jgi:Na+/proline symporter